ncbi:hypothetical protein GGQ88_000131 [Novosphingobium hassiacum]|uniref:DUF3486 family protein n=1 Tax=Novosphingobium hassiacum TaxID=173676 RepID=A0A7W5ZRX0_9SPHN|nr:phage protein Gp27 family protein [Novosphingobium hassiacum]MBB3858891.1 hypothetical protein [Novosphingobium hassiacum]
MGQPESAAERESRREGRGRLSSIEMLPEECDEDIAWANAELREKKMPQTEILRQFNGRLADRGLKGISKGAFSRWSVRVAIEVRKLDASRKLMNEVLAQLQPGERSDSMIAATELLKYRILEQVMSEDEPDPKLLLNATLALQRLSSTAARESAVQRRDKLDQAADATRAAEQQKQAQAEADAAARVEKIAGEAGLNADRIAAIRKGVLGLAA